MALTKTWYTVDEVVAKYGVKRETLLTWVDEGVVRSESEARGVLLINGDDVDLMVEERVFRA